MDRYGGDDEGDRVSDERRDDMGSELRREIDVGGSRPMTRVDDPVEGAGSAGGAGSDLDTMLDDDLNDDLDPEESTSSAHRAGRALLDWIIVVGIALTVAVVVRTFVLGHYYVDGMSMYSTLDNGDRVFVNKLSYRLHDPNRGDVVVLHQFSGATERDLIKRVIALPGETIEIRSCQVFIDGRLLEEPYLDPAVVMPGNCGGDFAPVTVPEGHVFVMGDNRTGSQDSRALGPIPEKDLVGRAFVVFWPYDDWQWL
jgi:signal peptidase I